MKSGHALCAYTARLLSGIVLAVVMQPFMQVQADSTVRFHGTLMAASCTPDAMEVEFGEISLDKISSVTRNTIAHEQVRSIGKSLQYFNLSLNCKGSISDIKYKWSGTLSTFDASALATDMAGLAINIGDGDTATVIMPDTWQSLDKSARTKNMLAVLIRDKDATFAGGEFNATATFTIQVP